MPYTCAVVYLFVCLFVYENCHDAINYHFNCHRLFKTKQKEMWGRQLYFVCLCHVENECVPSLDFKYDLDIIWVVAFASS